MVRDSVKSAVRVFEILEYFARSREPSRLSDIADHLGHPTSSVSALLKSMVRQGYMRFDEETHRYLPSARIAQLTAWINIDGFEQTVVLEAMHELRSVLGEPVVLATPNDIFLEYVESLHNTAGINSHIRPGTRRLLILTGTGWLFLSRMPREEATSLYQRTIDAGELTAEEFPLPAFHAKLDQHRQVDLSYLRAKDVLRPMAHWGAAMATMIIPSPPGHRPLALGVHGPAERLEKKIDRIATEMKRAILRIQDHLRR